MKLIIVFGMFCLTAIPACGQESAVSGYPNLPNKKDIKTGGPCEGCEAIYECPVLFDQLNEIDTLPGFGDEGKKLEVSGRIFQADGKTPAAGVILYVYHTDQKGIYPVKANAKDWARRHGSLRGWVRTDENGHYKFFTLRPASYPQSKNPAHIHATIKEQGKTEYWIDDFLFADDPFLPAPTTGRMERGGNGVLKTRLEKGIWKGYRDIVLNL